MALTISLQASFAALSRAKVLVFVGARREKASGTQHPMISVMLSSPFVKTLYQLNDKFHSCQLPDLNH